MIRGAAASLGRGLVETADMIKVQHTVFALPFALVAMVEAAGEGWPRGRTWLWVLVAMFAARTAAMAFNRLVDHEIDAANPRTRDRALPAGRLRRGLVVAVTAAAVGLFLLAAARLNPLCFALAPPTVAVLLGYSYAKRFTALAHLWLGLALGLAPIGAWLAVTGRPAVPPVLLGLAVTCWVAGFDVVYSLQDEEFDRRAGLRSLPAHLGAGGALVAARALHLLALIGFATFAATVGGGLLRWAAVLAAAGLVTWQHTLVRPDDLSRVDAAFFTANGTLAVAMGVLFVAAHPAPTPWG